MDKPRKTYDLLKRNKRNHQTDVVYFSHNISFSNVPTKVTEIWKNRLIPQNLKKNEDLSNYLITMEWKSFRSEERRRS